VRSDIKVGGSNNSRKGYSMYNDNRRNNMCDPQNAERAGKGGGSWARVLVRDYLPRTGLGRGGEEKFGDSHGANEEARAVKSEPRGLTAARRAAGVGKSGSGGAPKIGRGGGEEGEDNKTA